MDEKVVNLGAKQHIYEVENCAGCHAPINGEYEEIGLPNGDDTEVKHIALCPQCYQSALDHGVLF